MTNSAGFAGIAAAILLVIRLFIAGTFIRAGAVKLADIKEFRLAVANYDILPAGLVAAAAVTVPAVEVVAGLLLLLGVLPVVVAAVLAALLLCFSAAIAVNLARGRVFDCGCGSNVTPQTIGWRHIAVNALLAGGATAVAVAPPASLELLRGPSGLVSIAVPGGSDVPLVLTAALGFMLTRVLGAAVAARTSFRIEEVLCQ
jgi:uncharacterized membrane protein YphA (DoxX/SURF4 family)